MAMLLFKYGLTALLVVGVSEIARNSEKLGAFIGAMPIISFFILTWLYVETKNTQKIAEYSVYTFWYVIPTLPVFLILPWLLSKNINFWICLLISSLICACLFFIVSIVAKSFGVKVI